MKFVLLIAVFCVVPCAFQDIWEDYDTWYDDINNIDDGNLVANSYEPKEEQVPQPESVEIDGDKDGWRPDYGSEIDYRDYEIEDNRDEVKNKVEDKQEPNQDQDIEENDDIESAVQDFDAFQQLFDNDKLSGEMIDKILAVDEKSQMDLKDLLEDDGNAEAIPDDIEILNGSEEQNLSEGDDDIGVQVESVELKRDNIDGGDQDVQSNIEEIRNETQQLLEEFGSEFDENADDDTINNNNENKETKDEPPFAYEIQNSDIVEEDVKKIMDETRQVLEETNIEFDENEGTKEKQSNDNIEEEMKDIIDETHQILEETNRQFDENKAAENDQPNVENTFQDVPALEVEEDDNDEDTPDKIYEDLNEDLDQLFETLKKLSEEKNGDEVDNNSEPNDDDNDAKIGEDDKENNDFDYEGEERILAARNDYYESINDKDLSDLFKDLSDYADNNEDEDEAPILYVNDAIAADSSENKQQDTANDQQDLEIKSDENEKEKPDESNIVLDSFVPQSDDSPPVLSGSVLDENGLVDREDMSVKATKDVDELTSSELDELSKQFVMTHESEIKMAIDDTPVHITLNAEEPVVITSPNYPSPYPTDQAVLDWVLEGLGTGIELNVTDLQINSAQGHFLMLKPGQTDASGDSGIVFAYRLNSERRYRFRDVNRIFVRFNPLGGMAFSRGFQLSAKMIEPPGGASEDPDLPEPEALVPEPAQTATLILAGVNSAGFLELRDEFQRLLADMATMYINANDIDPGLNSTNEVTQITRTYVCNVAWPEFDSCVKVTFGVPLVYENETTPSRLTESDLMDMWENYSNRDPFATRLRQMGISDYTVPEEDRILTLWVVVGVGVVIAATMMAFALWRYSCIENYTKMQEFNDTESIQEKKLGLDMYPTPHQTLPPLFTESDYQWADRTFDDSTRVDMGGFTNKSFTRDELSSESDDDVVVSRDRYTTDV